MSGLKISSLPLGTTPQAGHRVAMVQGGSTNGVTFGQISDAISAAAGAAVIPSSVYSSIPTGSHRIDFTDTSAMRRGRCTRIVQGGITYHHIVTDVAADHVILAGPSLSTVVAMSSLAILDPSRSGQVDVLLSDAYEAAGNATDLIARETRSRFVWSLPEARLARATARHETPNTGADQPHLNVTVGGAAVFLDSGGNGLQLPPTAATVEAVQADASNYVVEFGDVIELDLSASTDRRSFDLTVSLQFVLV